ncbi:hypothetical protein DFH28DRAFT_928221 [Melampsora americana]|nr:hypothetical protein DFH28DRAFT_928221 [Melampsora americana]
MSPCTAKPKCVAGNVPNLKVHQINHDEDQPEDAKPKVKSKRKKMDLGAMEDDLSVDGTENPKKKAKSVRMRKKLDPVEKRDDHYVTGIDQDKQPFVVPAKPRVRAKPAKRKGSNLPGDCAPKIETKGRTVVSTGSPVVAAVVTGKIDESESTSGAVKGASANKSARKELGKGWKGYALVDVEELNAGSGSKSDAKVSSQESNGHFKIPDGIQMTCSIGDKMALNCQLTTFARERS